jgi:hypothetical protein
MGLNVDAWTESCSRTWREKYGDAVATQFAEETL